MSNSIIRVPKGNDWHIQLLVSEEGSDQHIDLHEVSDLKVELIHLHCGRTVTPPYSIGVSGALQIELEAHQQELGLYDARISFTRPNSKYSDGLEHRTISVRDAIKVVHAHEGGDKGVTITAQMASIAKGDKGDPGDPMELLDELSRQQSVRMDEIATAQSVSLTSIGSRLSDEQRTALEELAGRLSREQAGQIAQQTERLSTEQASGLQTISDRLSSEQTQTLERQGQERATAQRSALEAIPAKVTDEVARLMPDAVSGRIGGEVQAQLSDVVAQQIPEQVEEQLPAQVDSRLPDLVDGRLPDVADNKLPAVIDAKLPALVDERISGAVETAMPSHLGTALPPVVASALPSEVERQLPPLVRPAVQPAVKQVMATDLATRVAQGLKIGTRNLVIRSTILPKDKWGVCKTTDIGGGVIRVERNNLSNRQYGFGPIYDIRITHPINIGDNLSLSFWIRGGGTLSGYYLYILDRYGNNTPIRRRDEGLLPSDDWVKIEARSKINGPIHAYGVLVGIYGGDDSWAEIKDVILVYGDTPPLSWIPAPEDTYANLAEERLVALSQGRSQLWAQYGKIAPNSSLSSEAQTAVERLWTNYDGAYNRLRTALQGVVNLPSEQAYAALSSLSDQYQTTASDLQAGMTEAMLSVSPAGQIDYDTLAQTITGAIALDSESRLTIKGQPIGESLRGAEGRSAILSVAGVRPVLDRPDHSGVYRRNRRDTIYSPDLGTPESQGYTLFPNTQRYYQSHIMGASNMDFLWLYTPPSDHSSLVMVVQSQSRSGATPIISYKTSTGVVRVEGQVLRAAGTLTHYLAACALHDVVGQIWITMTSGDPGGDTGMYSMALYRMSIDEAPRIRGTWVQRPKTPYIGQQYIATDMRRNGVGDLPMWYNGVMWIDYEGHDVTRRYLIE